MSENFREQLQQLPSNLANHLEISIIALLVGVLISVPLAIFVSRRERLRYPVMTAVGVIQTIPSLALLALMVPLLAATDGFLLGLSAFGFYPAVIALTLYSMLPILRNTVTGILGVDPNLTEAARGVGMSEKQVLYRVQLPLAAPVIIAGIRTATIWVVGVATLATPVGQKCLGNYIFTGLQTRNWLMVWFGVVAAAFLAILLDLLIGGLERAAQERRKGLAWLSTGSLVFLLLAGIVSPSLVQRADAVAVQPTPTTATAQVAESAPAETKTRELREVKIGAKTFSEQYILAALLGSELHKQGLKTSLADSLGSTIVFDALRNGDIDVYVDYSGTIWANYIKRTDVPSRWRVLAETNAWLATEHGIRGLGSLGFENAYAIAIRKEDAERLGIQTIADLASHSSSMKIGGDYEFFARPEWKAMRDAYRLNFSETVSYDSSLMYSALVEKEVDAISAFSSDGRIAAFELFVLKDPKQVIPPYDAVVLVSKRAANEPKVINALQPLIQAIPVELMRQANLMVDRDEDKKTAREAAEWLRSRIKINR
ncbi:MAG: ABC transporter permease/substrate-binding protein [Proteobacteria bacterium]|nr:ABC transporter permease/substrate-binding protein [Pseudomonadota bacterium]